MYSRDLYDRNKEAEGRSSEPFSQSRSLLFFLSLSSAVETNGFSLSGRLCSNFLYARGTARGSKGWPGLDMVLSFRILSIPGTAFHAPDSEKQQCYGKRWGK